MAAQRYSLGPLLCGVLRGQYSHVLLISTLFLRDNRALHPLGRAQLQNHLTTFSVFVAVINVSPVSGLFH